MGQGQDALLSVRPDAVSLPVRRREGDTGTMKSAIGNDRAPALHDGQAPAMAHE